MPCPDWPSVDMDWGAARRYHTGGVIRPGDRRNWMELQDTLALSPTGLAVTVYHSVYCVR